MRIVPQFTCFVESIHTTNSFLNILIIYRSQNRKKISKMLVVVYLQDAKRYTVVPESFIYDLNEKNLKNLGVNRNQSRLIYFSQYLFENLQANENLDEQFEPNFHCPITKVYPLPETCFIGRMICFEGENSLDFYKIALPSKCVD